ncbi:hypothetical protein SBADM41S_05550 [Streptomyces badius]
MVTFAQAQERADEWVNGDVPAYQHREVRVREFELGFVVWAEDRPEGPVSDGGRQRLVIARDSGEATLWPGLPVGEVIRRYEEEYGAPAGAPAAAPEPPQRVDLNQTSFLLTPPEWLQEAAGKLGIPDHRAERREAEAAEAAEPSPSSASSASPSEPQDSPGAPSPVRRLPGAAGGPGPAAAGVAGGLAVGAAAGDVGRLDLIRPGLPARPRGPAPSSGRGARTLPGFGRLAVGRFDGISAAGRFRPECG